MTKLNVLKGKLREKGKTYEECAEHIGVTKVTFNNKMNAGTSFMVEEAQELSNFLELTNDERINIFLS